MASNGDTAGETVEVDSKKRLITGRLQKRDDERQADILRKQEEKSQTAAVQESTVTFQSIFQREKSDLESEIVKSDEMEKSLLVEHFDTLSTKLSRLQKYVAESTIFLSSYQVSRAQQIIVKLQQSIQEKRDCLLPKKKFAFKGKRTEKPKEPKVSSQDKVDGIPKDDGNLTIELAACKFVDESDKKLEKFDDEINQKDVALANLSNCTVNLFGSPSAIHINKLRKCRIFTGPVSGSVFIRDCKDCLFLLPCQQLRIHSTKDTDFYIHVTSKAIIEDCSTTRFAPYSWSYDKLDMHYEMSGLDKKRNNWDDVDDFNWLAADVHSPNWTVIPEAERHKEWEI